MGGIMEILLMVAVVLIALAIMTQAGVLIAMYLMSRRMAGKAEVLMDDSRKLMVPLKSITNNLKNVSDDLSETGKIARAQALQIQEIVTESKQNIREQMAEVRGVVNGTMQDARAIVLRPIRHYSAIAMGISEGIRVFFRRKPKESEIVIAEEGRQFPAA
jgi:hypothetical protein